MTNTTTAKAYRVTFPGGTTYVVAADGIADATRAARYEAILEGINVGRPIRVAVTDAPAIPTHVTATFLLPGDDTVHALDVSLAHGRRQGLDDNEVARRVVAVTINARCPRITFALGRRVEAADVTIVELSA